MGAQVIRAVQSDPSQHGQHGFRTQFLVMSRMAARTRNRPLVRIRRIVLQQLRQRASPGLVHGGANNRFDGFEVQAAGLAAILKDGAQQTVYFAGNFLLDRFGRFFSRGCGAASSTGRKPQILVLTSTNCWLSRW